MKLIEKTLKFLKSTIYNYDRIVSKIFFVFTINGKYNKNYYYKEKVEILLSG